MTQPFAKTIEEQIGLQLPNGEVIWPPDLWHGFDPNSAADRPYILGSLRNAALSAGWPEEDFLKAYTWVVRNKVTRVLVETEELYTWEIEQPKMVAGVPEVIRDLPSEPDPEAHE